ncbi:hypothetical protein DFH08DRAFT_1071736 [Mycena albidolilacea]|uniref:F-box domain-containing protein n=1 Tax=Mycena albidolilacea TaxID=1033008 RepID=A0AAD7AQG4_9AGAR|nr:hypothetical protein DFH08DRAFT_1071736 [Mycena albidolilacea]
MAFTPRAHRRRLFNRNKMEVLDEEFLTLGPRCMDNLAQEVVDKLIDALHGIDVESMKACGLVCTRWVDLPILTFVRHLCLAYESDGNPQWLGNLERLRQCVNIRALEVDAAAGVHDLEPLRSHILSWAQHGFVSELTLIGPNMELSAVRDIISCVPSVKSLHLRMARANPFQPIQSLPPPLPLSLHTLALGPAEDGENDFFTWLLSFPVVPRFRSIKNLGAVQLGRHQETMERYFVHGGRDLQALTFKLHSGPGYPSDSRFLFIEIFRMRLIMRIEDISEFYGKILSHTPNLRHISLRFGSPGRRNILDILAPLNSPHLESMTISRDVLYTGNSLVWGDLDKALADPRFGNLQHFSANVRFIDGVEVPAITRWTQSLMPLAFARGLLGPRIPNPAMGRRRQRGAKKAKLGSAV